MITVDVGAWQLLITEGALPEIYKSYCEHAVFVDEIGFDDTDGRFSVVGVSAGNASGWPTMISAQKHKYDAPDFGLGVLLVPETSRLFLGAGTRLLCYDLAANKRLWQDDAEFLFWGWRQSGAFVSMSAELEFTVWTTAGERLWSTFVEPPWDFEVIDQFVEFNVMGKRRKHRLMDGKLID